MPTTAEITDFEDFTGRTVARRTIDIRARVTGYLDKIQFKDGGEVKQGDLLFEIDPRPYQTELARTQAALVQAEAHSEPARSRFGAGHEADREQANQPRTVRPGDGRPGRSRGGGAAWPKPTCKPPS